MLEFPFPEWVGLRLIESHFVNIALVLSLRYFALMVGVSLWQIVYPDMAFNRTNFPPHLQNHRLHLLLAHQVPHRSY